MKSALVISCSLLIKSVLFYYIIGNTDNKPLVS